MIKTIPTEEPGTIFRSDRKCWTYEDLRRMPESLEKYEIIDGVLHMAPFPHVSRHQRVISRLHLIMARWVDEHDAGEVFLSPADVVASPERVVQPDLFFVATDRLGIVGAYVDGAPDLVVEVLSPSSIEHDRVTKFSLYEEIEVKEYWIVDPDEHLIDVYAQQEEGGFGEAERSEAGETARSALLNGFSLSTDDIF